MSSGFRLPTLKELTSAQWKQLSQEFELMRQEAALKKRSDKLDEAMSEASGRAPAMKAVDACFVMDCTISMSGVIEAAKAKITEIQRRICKLLGHGGCVRFGIVAYRDHQFAKNIEVLPFSTDLQQVNSFISGLEAGGLHTGKLDECEDVLGGLDKAMTLQWQSKTRILYLLCDNPPHGKRFFDDEIKQAYLRRGGEGIIDLDPNNANQWGLPDGLMRKSMELQLNLVVLKYTKPWGSTCDKMFDIFAELRKDSANPSKPLQTLAFMPESCEDDFVSSIMEGTTQSLTTSRNATKRSNSEGGEKLALPVHSEVDWTGYLRTPWKSWPVYDAFVTHLRVVGLSSDPQQNTVVRKLHIRAEPFAEGAMRYAFPATTEDGKRFVLKVHKSGPEKAERECLADVQTQTYAKFFGDAFAQSFPDAPIQFLDSWQVDLQGCPICRHATLEPYLDGKYEKYTNNCGFIADGAKLAAAFSHFTYCHSGGQMMVTDLQGFGSSILTDPQIHCVRKDSFGRGNLGKDGMDQFFFGHTCNDICLQLDLKKHPMQLALEDEKTSIGSGNSAISSPISNHGSQMCELCLTLFKLRKQEYLDAINKYQAVMCAQCGAKVDASKCSVPCKSCGKEVSFSPFAIAIKGCAKPEKCRECELSEEWMFVDE